MDIPNVRPGALSGTMQEFGADPLPNETVETETQSGLVVPAGDLDSRVAWVSEAETGDERRERADALWQHEVDTGAPQHELDELAGRLTDAVYDNGEQLGGFDPAQPGDTELPPVEQAAGDSLGAQQPQVGDTGQPPAQVASPAGIEPTSAVGATPDTNPASDGPADPGATREPPPPSEAESGDDSVPSDANTADAPPADGQNSTSSSDDTGGN